MIKAAATNEIVYTLSCDSCTELGYKEYKSLRSAQRQAMRHCCNSSHRVRLNSLGGIVYEPMEVSDEEFYKWVKENEKQKGGN